MFSFGWKLLCASLLDTVFNNLYGLLIGRYIMKNYWEAIPEGSSFQKLYIASNLGAAIQAVLLPAFSASQDSRETVRDMVRRAIRLSSSFCCASYADGVICCGRYPGFSSFGRAMDGLCAVFADYVYLLLFLADSYYQSSGY